MKKLLHIIATPRGDESRTLQVSAAFLHAFKAKHPDWAVDEIELAAEELPSLSVKRVDGKYALLAGKDLSGEFPGLGQSALWAVTELVSQEEIDRTIRVLAAILGGK